jgi:biopolymer transport protein ExbB
LLLALIMVGATSFSTSSRLAAQDESKTNSKIATDDSPEGLDKDGKKQKPTLLRMMFDGNAFGLVIVVLILFLSVLSAFFIIEHAITITRGKLIPEHVMSDLEQHISRGEINQAIEICHRKENYSLATEVVLAGLERYQGSEFGFAEYRTAVEEAGEDHTGKLYRKTEILNVIGSIAPMLGLTGTVLGMIEAFNTIASRDGMPRPEELAGGIGQALITTLLGLVVAIPTMVAFSYFRNKIDSLVAEAGKRIERLMMPLGRKRKS